MANGAMVSKGLVALWEVHCIPVASQCLLRYFCDRPDYFPNRTYQMGDLKYGNLISREVLLQFSVTGYSCGIWNLQGVESL